MTKDPCTALLVLFGELNSGIGATPYLVGKMEEVNPSSQLEYRIGNRNPLQDRVQAYESNYGKHSGTTPHAKSTCDSSSSGVRNCCPGNKQKTRTGADYADGEHPKDTGKGKEGFHSYCK